MNKRYSHVLLASFILFAGTASAQMKYTFRALDSSYVPVVAAPSAWDFGNNDEGYLKATPAGNGIGFNFYFNDMPTPYTDISMSSNGFAVLGPTPLTDPHPENSLTDSPDVRPVLAPLWDNIGLDAVTGSAAYEVYGTAPHRIFKMEWVNALWPYQAAPTGGPSLSMELKLYETYNVIDFTYTQSTGLYTPNTASIGIGNIGTGTLNFMALENTSANPPVNSYLENKQISFCPPTNRVYRFMPLCDTVSGVVANCVGSITADMSWAPTHYTPGNAEGYQYVIDLLATTPGIGANIQTATSPVANLTGLMPATQYYFHVRTDCGMQNFSAWTTVAFTTEPACPTPTAYLTDVYTNANYSGASFFWSDPGAFDYEYIVDQVPSAPTTPGLAVAGTTISVTGLLAGTTYYMHVRAQCGPCNFSDWVTVAFTTPPVCANPTNLAINNITVTDADVSWDPMPSSIGYEYYVDQSPNPPAAPIYTLATSAHILGMLGGTQHFLHVRSDCDTGNFSAWSHETFITVDPYCDRPTGTHNTLRYATSATFEWNLIPGNDGFDVIVDQNPTVQWGEVITSTAFPAYTAVGLTPNTDYWFHIRNKCTPIKHSYWVDTPFHTDFPVVVNNLPGQDRHVMINAYPNPTSDKLNVTVSGAISGDATLELADITGKRITYVGILNGKAIIDLTEMPQGMYLVKYVDRYNSEVVKVYKR